jgi:hypothetical protein
MFLAVVFSIFVSFLVSCGFPSAYLSSFRGVLISLTLCLNDTKGGVLLLGLINLCFIDFNSIEISHPACYQIRGNYSLTTADGRSAGSLVAVARWHGERLRAMTMKERLEVHRKIEAENKRKLKEWKERRKTA